jgi:hypothetical protein
VLLVIARRNPLIYDLAGVVQNHKKGSETKARVVLTKEQLLAYVDANYGTRG